MPENAPGTQNTLGGARLPVEEIHSAASSGEVPTVQYLEIRKAFASFASERSNRPSRHSFDFFAWPNAKVRWHKISLGKNIREATTALYEHDLVVCFTNLPCELRTHIYFPSTLKPFTPRTPYSDDARMQIHLIRHSTGGSHPHANFPVLDICTEYDVKPPKISYISIGGAHLAFLLTYRDGPQDDTTFFYLWNWKSGPPNSGRLCPKLLQSCNILAWIFTLMKSTEWTRQVSR